VQQTQKLVELITYICCICYFVVVLIYYDFWYCCALCPFAKSIMYKYNCPCKSLYNFLMNKEKMLVTGTYQRGQEGYNSLGLNHYGGAEKSQQCHKFFLQYSTFASKRSQFQTWGLQTCFLSRAPSNLVTPLVGKSFAWFCISSL